MYILDDGIRLNACLERPENISKGPIAIVFHGLTGHMEEEHIRAVSETFRSLGMSTLRVELYGHGHSDGRFHDHTLYRWLTNALTVIDYTRSLDFVTDIYLCGHSQGGLTVMLTAAMERDAIKGLIPLSPAVMIPRFSREGNLLGLSFDPEHVPEQLTWPDGRTLGGNYIRVAQTIRVEDAIDHYTGPVLMIHGTADEAVPFAFAEKAASRYKSCRFVPIEGDTHCYDHHLDQVTSAVRAWMIERL